MYRYASANTKHPRPLSNSEYTLTSPEVCDASYCSPMTRQRLLPAGHRHNYHRLLSFSTVGVSPPTLVCFCSSMVRRRTSYSSAEMAASRSDISPTSASARSWKPAVIRFSLPSRDRSDALLEKTPKGAQRVWYSIVTFPDVRDSGCKIGFIQTGIGRAIVVHSRYNRWWSQLNLAQPSLV